MDIDQHLFYTEALRGERTSLKFRWLLIFVVMAFICITYFKGDKQEALLSFIPATIFLVYNIYLGFLLKKGKNFYFLRYLSVTIDILSLTAHIFINSRFFSSIAVATTASIFIYPVLMFLSVLRYDKRLIIYATFLTIVAFNINYFIQYHRIPKDLIEQVISSDPMGQVYKSGYLIILGVFFLKIPDMVFHYISRQKEAMLEKNEYTVNLLLEKREKASLKSNYDDLNILHQELQMKSNMIEEQNSKLNELIQTKDKLITFISHDLKNSFSTMVSIIETTKEGASNMESEDIVQAMDILYKHSMNNQILFENLLQWAKLQRGQLTLTKERINLHEFCLQAYKTYLSQIEAKNIKVEISIPDNSVVMADKIMLCSICGNLLGNAIKFTPRGGNIYINALVEKGFMKIMIKDTGVGIEKERIPGIFSVENTKTTKGTEGEKGSGFGLILCKELVDRMGGDISVESLEGQGSCFTIKLPGGVVDKKS